MSPVVLYEMCPFSSISRSNAVTLNVLTTCTVSGTVTLTSPGTKNVGALSFSSFTKTFTFSNKRKNSLHYQLRFTNISIYMCTIYICNLRKIHVIHIIITYLRHCILCIRHWICPQYVIYTLMYTQCPGLFSIRTYNPTIVVNIKHVPVS